MILTLGLVLKRTQGVETPHKTTEAQRHCEDEARTTTEAAGMTTGRIY